MPGGVGIGMAVGISKVVLQRKLPWTAAAGLPLFRRRGKGKRELRSRNPRAVACRPSADGALARQEADGDHGPDERAA
ncbi:MAG: hypothetical protein NTX53_06960 [candidate division WOR-3 bacterium]|nr:hypothetical protein [candidate division WOR-3 bacterium]